MSAKAAHLLTRATASQRPKRATSPVHLAPEIALARARVHEVHGPARRSFAAWLGRVMEGPVFWIMPDWIPDRPYPPAMARYINPARITWLTPKRAEDLLWSFEEALRSGAVPLVVADIPGTPTLTAVRRLHLAAETGAEEGLHAPVGCLLTSSDQGSPGVETRWKLRGDHKSGRIVPEHRWHLTRERARALPPQSWIVRDGDHRAPAGTGTLSLTRCTASGDVDHGVPAH